MNPVSINFQNFIQIHNSETITTSEFIAQAFKKQHSHVLRSIDSLLADIDPAFAAQNFRETETSTQNNLGFTVKNRAYELTKDGFMLLVMGFTGKAALAIKIAYIQAFNKMAEMLSGSLKPDFHLEAPTTPDERKPLRDAVFALAAQYGLAYSTAYKMVHQRFNVESIDMLPAEQIPAAVEYVHRLTLNGEVLDKQPEITFSQSELRELATITYYCAWSNNLLRELAAPLTALGYERASTVRTLPMESRGFIRRIHKALTREMPKIASAFERDDMQNSLNRCLFLL